jgi:hypothetical protein
METNEASFFRTVHPTLPKVFLLRFVVEHSWYKLTLIAWTMEYGITRDMVRAWQFNGTKQGFL